MITRVPVSISMGTRGTRELLMSLLVEALLLRAIDFPPPRPMHFLEIGIFCVGRMEWTG